MYNFASFWIEMDRQKIQIERSTYSILEWLGDVGGLYDGLLLILHYFISPLAAWTMKVMLLTKVFSQKKP